MKSNEDMVRSVLEKVNKTKSKHARIRRMGISIAMCFCMVVLTVFATAELWLPTQEGTETIEQNSKYRVAVFSVNAAEYKTMIKDVVVQTGIMHVRDMKGYSELERVFIRREEMALVEEFTKGSWRSSNQRREKDDAIFVMGLSEVLMIVPEDIEQVVEFSAKSKSGETVWTAINPHRDGKTGEFVRSIDIWWDPPEEQVNKLLADPHTKLSVVEDTITVTVKFTDGSIETVVIDVNVDDNGNISMVYRGTK